MNENTICEKRFVLKKAGVSDTEVMNQLKVSRKWLSKWWSGRMRLVRPPASQFLAEVEMFTLKALRRVSRRSFSGIHAGSCDEMQRTFKSPEDQWVGLWKSIWLLRCTKYNAGTSSRVSKRKYSLIWQRGWWSEYHGPVVKWSSCPKIDASLYELWIHSTLTMSMMYVLVTFL